MPLTAQYVVNLPFVPKEGTYLLIYHKLLHLLLICLPSQYFPPLFTWFAFTVTAVPSLHVVIAINCAPPGLFEFSHLLVGTSAPGIGPHS